MKLDNVNVSSIKCISHYRNSRHGRHDTRLQLVPFYIKAMYWWSCLS